MDKKNISSKSSQYRIEHFRTPSPAELEIGLWVDRIGHRQDNRNRAIELSSNRLLGQYAAVYVESGEGYLVSGNNSKKKVQAGDTMLIFPDEPAVYCPKKIWMTKWIVWNGPNAKILEKLGIIGRENMLIKDHARSVEHAHSLLSKIISREDIATVLERKIIILEMMYELFGSICKTHQKHYTDEIIDKAVDFFAKHYTENAQMSEMIDAFQATARSTFSKVHFRRLFHNYTGRSPMEYVTSMRIAKAKELLCQKKSIKEVAGEVGYEDVFYFMRIFKKVAGISPKKFADMHNYTQGKRI